MAPLVMAYSHCQPLKACFIWNEKKIWIMIGKEIKTKQKSPMQLLWFILQRVYKDDGTSNMIRTKCAKRPWRFQRCAAKLMAEVRGVKWLISIHSSISPVIKSVLRKSDLINGTLGIWSRQILPSWFIISACFHSGIYHTSPLWQERFLFKCQAVHFSPSKYGHRCNYDLYISVLLASRFRSFWGLDVVVLTSLKNFLADRTYFSLL